MFVYVDEMLALLWSPKASLKAFLVLMLLFCLWLSHSSPGNGVASAFRPDQLRRRLPLHQHTELHGEGESIIYAAKYILPHSSPSFVSLSTKSDSDEYEVGSGGVSETSASEDEKKAKEGDSSDESKERGEEEGSRSEEKDEHAAKPGKHYAAAASKAGAEEDESNSGVSKKDHRGKAVEHDGAKEHHKPEGKGSGDDRNKKEQKQEGTNAGEESVHEDTHDKSGKQSVAKDGSENGKNEGKQKGEGNYETPDRDQLVARLTKLLYHSGGSELLGRLESVLKEHEKEEERKASEEAKKKEKEDAKKKEEEAKEKVASLKEKLEEAEKAAQEETQKEAPARDLLLTQQLNALWMLPFLHDKSRTETCLSGFEKLTAQSRIKCRDPACLKLEQDKACAFLDVHSIDRASLTNGQNMGIHIGFDPTCRDATQLGSQVLELLQHPVKQHELEQRLESIGTGATVQSLTNHLDLVCEGSDPATYPTCNAVSQALRNVPHLGPKNLPSMVVLADISDIPNTVGLFRIAVLFEGRVPLVDANGDLVDNRGAKLSDSAAHEVLSKLHDLQR